VFAFGASVAGLEPGDMRELTHQNVISSQAKQRLYKRDPCRAAAMTAVDTPRHILAIGDVAGPDKAVINSLPQNVNSAILCRFFTTM
jgi:hypothetical protein